MNHGWVIGQPLPPLRTGGYTPTGTHTPRDPVDTRTHIAPRIGGAGRDGRTSSICQRHYPIRQHGNGATGKPADVTCDECIAVLADWAGLYGAVTGAAYDRLIHDENVRLHDEVEALREQLQQVQQESWGHAAMAEPIYEALGFLDDEEGAA